MKWFLATAARINALLLALTFFAASFAIAEAQTSMSGLADDQLSSITDAMGAHRSGCTSVLGGLQMCMILVAAISAATRAVANHQHTAILVQAYEVVSGGRVAFLYDQPLNSTEWEAVGVVYDSLSADGLPMSTFLPTKEVGKRVFQCVDEDSFHHLEGQTQSPTTYALWSMGSGRTMFARYLLNGEMPTLYNAVTGKDELDLSKVPRYGLLVQWGLFHSAMRIVDLHIAQDDDYSIVTAFKHCER